MELERRVREGDIGGVFILLESNVYSQGMLTKMMDISKMMKFDNVRVLLGCYMSQVDAEA